MSTARTAGREWPSGQRETKLRLRIAVRRVRKGSMEEFQSKMVQVDAGEAVMLQPVSFSGRVSESELEKWLIENPALAGEPLLVLGSQLAEFAEDKDRLDVLAVDKRGEIVLLELKVDGAFRLTDLQALAYAAGYSALDATHFAEILRKRWEKSN